MVKKKLATEKLLEKMEKELETLKSLVFKIADNVILIKKAIYKLNGEVFILKRASPIAWSSEKRPPAKTKKAAKKEPAKKKNTITGTVKYILSLTRGKVKSSTILEKVMKELKLPKKALDKTRVSVCVALNKYGKRVGRGVYKKK